MDKNKSNNKYNNQEQLYKQCLLRKRSGNISNIKVLERGGK